MYETYVLCRIKTITAVMILIVCACQEQMGCKFNQGCNCYTPVVLAEVFLVLFGRSFHVSDQILPLQHDLLLPFSLGFCSDVVITLRLSLTSHMKQHQPFCYTLPLNLSCSSKSLQYHLIMSCIWQFISIVLPLANIHTENISSLQSQEIYFVHC